MLLLVQGASVAMEARRGMKRLGILMSPNASNSPKRLLKMGYPMALDNGCFSFFDERAYRRMLGLCRGFPLLWCTAPDVVGDAQRTLDLFQVWEPVIRSHGLKVAMVAQDGLTADRVPWDRIDCLFIGGTDEWKLYDQSVALCREAKRRGKLLHIGRCNSLVRIRAAAAMGADSIDGSQFSWWPDRYIPKGLRWIRIAMADVAAGVGLFGTCPAEQAIARARLKSIPGPLGPKRRRPPEAIDPLFPR